MKNVKCLLWGLMLAFVQTVSAQTNPVDGIVITNEGDTLHGTLDYLSSNINAMECHFRKEGDSEFKVYAPGEIKGYRFLSDGVFYVTKTMPVDKVDRTFFAEFLLQGGVSLYRYIHKGTEYFFIENENGEIAQIADKNDSFTYEGIDKVSTHKKLGPAYYIFSKSEKAKEQLYKTKITAAALTQITRDYDLEFCRESGDCVQFQYDTKKSRRSNTHLMVLFGGEMMHCKDFLTTKWGFSPTVGVGVYATFPRINKHLALETSASISHYTFSYERNPQFSMNQYEDWMELDDHKVKWTCLSVPIMFNYLFNIEDENTVTPYIAFGFNNSVCVSNKANDLLINWFRPSIAFGVNVPLTNHTLRIGANGSFWGLVNSKTTYSDAAQNFVVNLSASYIF